MKTSKAVLGAKVTLGADKDPNQTIHGGTGDDHLVGKNGNDILFGYAGKDQLIGGGGDDKLYGGADNDELVAGGGDDYLNGGTGDDVLDGGGGADRFAYTFKLDLSGSTAESSPVFEDGIRQNLLSSRYTAWLESFGTDLNGDGKIDTDWSQKTGEVSYVEGAEGVTFGDVRFVEVEAGQSGPDHIRGYSSTAMIHSEALTSPDGHDVITGFQWGTDRLVLEGLDGLTTEQFDKFFKLEVADFNNNGSMDSKLSLVDGSWSVTLDGVSGHAEADFLAQMDFVPQPEFLG